MALHRNALIVLIACGTASAQEPAVILKHEGWVAVVAFSPDGKTLASAGADNVVRLCEVGTWKPKGVLRGHTDCVCAIAFPAPGDVIITGSFDGSARVWALDGSGTTLKVAQRRGAVTAICAGRLDVVPAVVCGGVDGAIVAYLDKETQTHSGHKSWVNSLVTDKNGVLASGSSDGTVRIHRDDGADSLEGGAGEVRCVAFSPNGKLLAAGNRYHTVRIWDVESKKEIKTLTGHMSDVWSIAFSPDGKTLAAADTDWKKPSKVKLWDTTTWKERGAIDVPGEILSIAYSPKGDWLAVGSWDKTVRVFAIR